MAADAPDWRARQEPGLTREWRPQAVHRARQFDEKKLLAEEFCLPIIEGREQIELL
jgi:hypothetical protein